uniref:Subtilisin n=1 Tax=Alexandrium monilatum TaxID=311494 RepID=A0A7S4T2Y1_9DINO
MKTAAVLCALLLVRLGFAARVARDRHVEGGRRDHHGRRHDAEQGEHMVPPPGLVPLGAAAPAPSSAMRTAAEPGAIADLEMSFDILNYNYSNMEQDIGDTSTKSEAGAFLETGELFGETVALTVDHVIGTLIEEGLGNVSDAGQHLDASIALPASPMPLPGSLAPLKWAPSPAAVGGVGLAAAPPVPSPAPPSAMPAKAAASVVAPGEQVNIFVSFRPGPKPKLPRETFLQASGPARSTTVDVMITNKPNTGADVLPQVGSILMNAQADGLLKRRLKAALFQATGIRPMVKGLRGPVPAHIRQWEEGHCEMHMERLVRLMEVAYTRRMVPQALYNECTNFIASLTFSHDAVASPLDRRKCRIATIKFAKRWDYGKAEWTYGMDGKQHKPTDFSGFCRDVCETRFGEDAPQCGVNAQVKTGT